MELQCLILSAELSCSSVGHRFIKSWGFVTTGTDNFTSREFREVVPCIGNIFAAVVYSVCAPTWW
jgi:hypothetical protein